MAIRSSYHLYNAINLPPNLAKKAFHCLTSEKISTRRQQNGASSLWDLELITLRKSDCITAHPNVLTTRSDSHSSTLAADRSPIIIFDDFPESILVPVSGVRSKRFLHVDWFFGVISPEWLSQNYRHIGVVRIVHVEPEKSLRNHAILIRISGRNILDLLNQLLKR